MQNIFLLAQTFDIHAFMKSILPTTIVHIQHDNIRTCNALDKVQKIAMQASSSFRPRSLPLIYTRVCTYVVNTDVLQGTAVVEMLPMFVVICSECFHSTYLAENRTNLYAIYRAVEL